MRYTLEGVTLTGFYLTVVLLLGVPVTVVTGFPSGAPLAACSTISPDPSAHGANPQTSAVPYTVNISSLANGYVPGQSYAIVLSGTTTEPNFRGFLIQGRVMADETATGIFTDNGDDQRVTCTGDTSVTHVSSNEKTMVELMWTAPAEGTGTILFRYAVVDVRTVYWANQATATIDEVTMPSGGNDPHFFLPLQNGDNLCFSVQGQPDFMFNLIKDRYVELNTQFVLPAEDESHTIANVSTFLGNLGLLLRSPATGSTMAIKISAQDHTVLVGNSITTVKDKPVIVQVSNTFIVDITADANQQFYVNKNGSAWLYINVEFGFGIKVRFYKRHLDLLLTKTSGLTNEVHGLMGQFLTENVEVDEDYNLMKFGNRKPISVRKGPAWPYLHINKECWYGAATDNQGTGVIDGNYLDYVVQDLIP